MESAVYALGEFCQCYLESSTFGQDLKSILVHTVAIEKRMPTTDDLTPPPKIKSLHVSHASKKSLLVLEALLNILIMKTDHVWFLVIDLNTILSFI